MGTVDLRSDGLQGLCKERHGISDRNEPGHRRLHEPRIIYALAGLHLAIAGLSSTMFVRRAGLPYRFQLRGCNLRPTIGSLTYAVPPSNYLAGYRS